ncbi:MAG: hypothetical protein ACK559_29980, partial [bacterium]
LWRPVCCEVPFLAGGQFIAQDRGELIVLLVALFLGDGHFPIRGDARRVADLAESVGVAAAAGGGGLGRGARCPCRGRSVSKRRAEGAHA